MDNGGALGEVAFELDVQSNLYKGEINFLNEELNSDLMKVENGNTELPFNSVVGEEGEDRFANRAFIFRVFLSSVFSGL